MPAARVNFEEETTREGDGGREVMRRGDEKWEEGLGYEIGVGQASKFREWRYWAGGKWVTRCCEMGSPDLGLFLVDFTVRIWVDIRIRE